MFLRPRQLDDARRVDAAIAEIEAQFGSETVFYADHLITVGRATGFLHDPRFRTAFDDAKPEYLDAFLHWRLHVLCWAAESALNRSGAFVECGVLAGFSMRVVARYLDFETTGREMYLYDLFDNPGGAGQGGRLPQHGPNLHTRVRRRFAAYPSVQVVQGRIPEILDSVAPETIAFMHIDLNDADAEIAALERLWPRVSSGGLVVFDDYGWAAHAAQRLAIDAFLRRAGVGVLELPTGQGLALKP